MNRRRLATLAMVFVCAPLTVYGADEPGPYEGHHQVRVLLENEAQIQLMETISSS